MKTTPEEEFAETVSNAVNPMSFSAKAFVKAMSRKHRTLQQSFTKLCFAWIDHLAELKEGEYDARNEASVRVSKEIMLAVDKYDMNLPLI